MIIPELDDHARLVNGRIAVGCAASSVNGRGRLCVRWCLLFNIRCVGVLSGGLLNVRLPKI